MNALVFLLLVAALARSQEPPAVAGDPAITATDLSRIVHVLAADELQGRRCGSEGAREAAEFIGATLAASGVEPAGADGTFFQDVPLVRVEYTSPPSLVLERADGTTFVAVPGKDYTWSGSRPFPCAAQTVMRVADAERIPPPPASGAALFVDLERDAARALLRDRNLTAPGGWSLFLCRGPAGEGEEITRPPRGGWLALAPRDEHGAVTVRDGAREPRPQVLWLRSPLADRLAAGEFERASWQVEWTLEAVADRNVVGILPGAGSAADPALAAEVIVFSAHFDHVGTRAAEDGESAEADLVHNGADDDASGVAAVLELAAAYAAGPRPARTLVFLLATGEEVGLLGTHHYLEHPARPLANTVLNLNFEMIGRPDALVGGPGNSWLTGAELTTLAEPFAAAGIVADPRPTQQFFKRSDNWAFVERGIVGQTLSSYDLHADYHTVRDEAHLLDYEHMQTVVRRALEAMAPLVAGRVSPAWREGVDPREL